MPNVDVGACMWAGAGASIHPTAGAHRRETWMSLSQVGLVRVARGAWEIPTTLRRLQPGHGLTPRLLADRPLLLAAPRSRTALFASCGLSRRSHTFLPT